MSEFTTKTRDPVRFWTFVVLIACLILIALYLVADRHTPFTTQARVHAYVIPIGSPGGR